jgi:hypothetical protein
LHQAVTQPGTTAIVVDFGQVSFCDSSSIESLDRAYGAASDAGIILRLLNLQPIVRQVLDLVGILETLTDPPLTSAAWLQMQSGARPLATVARPGRLASEPTRAAPAGPPPRHHRVTLPPDRTGTGSRGRQAAVGVTTRWTVAGTDQINPGLRRGHSPSAARAV